MVTIRITFWPSRSVRNFNYKVKTPELCSGVFLIAVPFDHAENDIIHCRVRRITIRACTMGAIKIAARGVFTVMKQGVGPHIFRMNGFPAKWASCIARRFIRGLDLVRVVKPTVNTISVQHLSGPD